MDFFVKYAFTLLYLPKLRETFEYYKKLIKWNIRPVNIENELQYLILPQFLDIEVEPLNKEPNDIILARHPDLPVGEHHGQLFHRELLNAQLALGWGWVGQISKIKGHVVYYHWDHRLSLKVDLDWETSVLFWLDTARND